VPGPARASNPFDHDDRTGRKAKHAGAPFRHVCALKLRLGSCSTNSRPALRAAAGAAPLGRAVGLIGLLPRRILDAGLAGGRLPRLGTVRISSYSRTLQYMMARTLSERAKSWT
jgi:hypothetical protein